MCVISAAPDTEDPAALKAEIKRLELELKKKNRQLSAAQAQLERFSNVNVMQHEVVGSLKTEMSRQEKFMTMLLKYSKNTILLLDKNLNIAYYTDNFFQETVKGSDPVNIEGKSAFDVHRHYFGDSAAGRIREIIEKAIVSKDTQIVKERMRFSGGGEYLIYYLYVTGMFDDGGGLDGVILLYTDVTELEDARVQAVEASKTKSEFLAKMSHEIRTPMNTIIGMSDLMPRENLTPLQKRYFSDIKKMSKVLLGIINDILDFSKAESGKMELSPVHFNIRNLFHDMCSMQSFIARQKSLEFRSRCSPAVPEFIYADETRIHQIFTNLINNAIKYTKQGSVSFTLDTGTSPGKGKDPDGEYLIAKIADTGVGIKKEHIPYLFESFQQMDTRKNKGIEGTGLGLAIVKQLLNLMSGFIEVESEYGAGSVFTMYIPLVRGDPLKAEDLFKDTRRLIASEGVRVLVVDDVRTNLDVASGFLKRHRISADVAGGGSAAIDLVAKSLDEKRPYDLIFMDHMMPGMDGIEATRRIRELEKSRRDEKGNPPNIPVICLSANAVQGAKELFLASGMDGFIAKPIEGAALNRTLRQFLPEGKYTFVDIKNEKAAARKPNPREDQILQELLKIRGLNIRQGLHYAAENFETYLSTLKQVSRGMEKGLAVIRESLAAEDWQSYAVQVHAYKGIFATIGMEPISGWGKKLEDAAKGGDTSLCAAETEDFCAALTAFNAALRKTPLFAEPEETKTEIGAPDMAAKLTDLAEACDEGGSARIKAAVKDLAGLRLSNAAPGFEAALAETLNLARSMDYDEAAEKARETVVQLTG
jgi:signal transduction histidine kinase/DNA-binding response OmpR family regulator